MSRPETDVLQTLQNLSLFEGVASGTLHELSEQFVEMRYVGGACVWLQDATAFLFSIICEGQVEVIRKWGEGEITRYDAPAGQCAGFAAIHGELGHDCTAISLGDTRILAISGEHIREILPRDPRLQSNLVKAMVRHENWLRKPGQGATRVELAVEMTEESSPAQTCDALAQSPGVGPPDQEE